MNILSRIKASLQFVKQGNESMLNRPSIYTMIPGQSPIELVAYYDEFKDYYTNCELNVKDWFVNNIKEDWTIFDCGANIGYYSILFAKLAPKGHVYAFEPTDTYQMLLDNLSHHNVNNVTPLKLALGLNSGEFEDSIYRIWGNDADKKVYSFTTIDEFMKMNSSTQRLDCIKIDVDSFDFEVLQGAEETLIKYDPFVVVELNHALSRRNQYNTQALQWMASLGYREGVVLDYDNFLFKRDCRLYPSSSTNGLSITLRFSQSHSI